MSCTTHTRTFKNAVYDHLATVGKALSSSTRLEILEVLAQAPRTVDSIATEVDQSVANTSQHLQKLKKARLVTGRRDGLHVIYSLSGKDVVEMLDQLNQVAGKHIKELEALATEFFGERDGLEAVDHHTLFERIKDGSAVLIDVRPEEEYDAGHLPGALSIPIDELEAHIESLPTDRTIVAYCRGPYCAWSADAVTQLRAKGYDARRADVSAPSWNAGDQWPDTEVF